MSLRAIAVLAFSFGCLLEPIAGLELAKTSGKSASENAIWPNMYVSNFRRSLRSIADRVFGHHAGIHLNSTKFVLLSQPRSGARFVMDMLTSHPRLKGGREELHKCCKKEEGSPSFACSKKKMLQVLDDWFSDGSFWQEHPGIKARGFQVQLKAGLLHADGSPTGLADYLAKHGIKVLFLWRRNELRRHISIAAKTDQWAEQGEKVGWNLTRISHPVEEEDVKRVREFKPSMVTGAHLISKLRHGHMERTQAEEALWKIPADRRLTVFYEDLVGATNPDSETTWQKLQEFLGLPLVPAGDLRSNSTHVHIQREMTELLRNPEEVRASLAGTEYENMLM